MFEHVHADELAIVVYALTASVCVSVSRCTAAASLSSSSWVIRPPRPHHVSASYGYLHTSSVGSSWGHSHVDCGPWLLVASSSSQRRYVRMVASSIVCCFPVRIGFFVGEVHGFDVVDGDGSRHDDGRVEQIVALVECLPDSAYELVHVAAVHVAGVFGADGGELQMRG